MMDAKQRRHEIKLMARWLTESGDLDSIEHSGSPSRYHMVMEGHWEMTLPPKEAHAYLSGATDFQQSRRTR